MAGCPAGERGADASPIGRVRKYKPEGRIIDPGFDASVTVVSKTDGY